MRSYTKWYDTWPESGVLARKKRLALMKYVSGSEGVIVANAINKVLPDPKFRITCLQNFCFLLPRKNDVPIFFLNYPLQSIWSELPRMSPVASFPISFLTQILSISPTPHPYSSCLIHIHYHPYPHPIYNTNLYAPTLNHITYLQ